VVGAEVEAGVAVGRKDGRATALEVILPLKRGGRIWLRPWLALLRRSARLRRWAFRELDGLQFIFAIRWALLAPLEGGRWRHWPPMLSPDQRWHLLFQSNFDGDWDEYLDNFAGVLPRGLASLVWVGAGYTGLTSPDLFKRYAKLHDHIPEHYVSGYPRLSANDIRQELVARYGSAVVRTYERQGYAGDEPRWTTFVLPIRRGREGAAVRTARSLDTGGGDELLRTSGRVHFGRVVVDQQQHRAWLLITLTHDGDVETILFDLLEEDADRGAAATGTADERAGWLHALLACTGGVPPIGGRWQWDDGQLVRHLLHHRPRSLERHLTYCGYPGLTVQDVVALDQHARRHQGFPAWEGDP
jgi:hypothetical protein